MACNPYTAGKLAGDLVAQSYHLSYDLPVSTVRLFNVYGPRMGRFLIMPAIIQQLLRGRMLRLGDLTPARTFVVVEDIVEAYVRMAARLPTVGEVVHFGTTEEITMRDLVDQIAGLMGTSYELIPDESRLRPQKSEIYRIRVDHGKASRLLDWWPRTGLQKGLGETIAWFQGKAGGI